MDSWLKILSNGEEEFASEELIEKGLASWSRGRQDIVEVDLYLKDKTLTLSCPINDGNLAVWEQFDHYVSSLQSGQSVLFKKELTCTTNGYSGLNIITFKGGSAILISLTDEGLIKIPPSTAKISACLDISGSFSYRFSS